ncbi:Arginine/ornithine antiporter ArcD [Photobacterium marinum]|uniref:Arginine/ornithine antiporter ArcD n=2 Tax=Photobacterium marinum TaxID=1056511 RepID=L8J9H3_9GAMM|nr:YfcC family protein [Photobacterium marinum]ELR65446.1 Arginine/ornithine antiporter ArcD [Photobacterium marinum]
MLITEKLGKTFRFPTAFTILFIIMLLAIGLTWFVPAGSYSKLSYNSDGNNLLVTSPYGDVTSVAANQDELEKLNININIDQFVNGTIRKPIAIPDTYQRLEQSPKGLGDVAESMVKGTIEGADIIVFILILGGLIGVINKTGAFDAGLVALSKKTKGNEFLFVALVSIVMAIGGTTCGLEEEAVAFYPILVPIFLTLGYDSIVCVGAIFLAASIGTAFSTINPFSVVIASNAAGISFTEGLGIRSFGFLIGVTVVIGYLYWYCEKIKKNPSFSYTYEDREEFRARFLKNGELDTEVPFTLRRKVILTLFAIAFPLMVWGVSVAGWWFPQMAASFLTIAIIIIFISGLNEKEAVEAFTQGASELVAVSLIIGMARGVNIVLEQGMVSDTILAYASDLVSGMHGSVFAVAQMFIFFLLGLVVPSSSGLAVLSMPIMAPLADTVMIPRDIVVSAYNWGQYAMLFLAPTGLVLVTLQMLDIQFNKWVKFVFPIVAFLLVFGSALLVGQVMMV